MYLPQTLSFVLLSSLHLVLAIDIYKVCVSSSTSSSTCEALEAGNSKVTCVQVLDSVECALHLSNGSAHFALYRPEQAVLASQVIDDLVSVIADIRYQSLTNESNGFSWVVLVRNNTIGSFSQLRGKNYCHPGFGSAYSFSDRILKFFERKATGGNCKTMVSAAEEEVAHLSGFFKSACRPGPWAQDDYLNNRLKQTYSNLCDLCESGTCDYDTKSAGNQQSALDCLTKNGDVTYVTLGEVKKYFGLIPGYQPQGDPSNYQLLCPDETTMDLTSQTPCTWVRQPWPVVVAKKDVSSELQDKLGDWLGSASDRDEDIWKMPLRQIVMGERYEKYRYVRTDQPKPLSQYIDRGCDNDDMDKKCREKVRWCTVGREEKAKCDWLRRASRSAGLVPELDCIPALNMWNCLRMISAGNADIIDLDTEYSYIARRMFNLSALMYEDNSHSSYFRVVAVIKDGNNQIKKFSDLRNKKACFPEYRGLGWVGFVNTATSLGLLKKANTAQRFFAKACAPGAMDTDHNLVVNPQFSNLCDICSVADGTDSCSLAQNAFYGDRGAMKCLSSDAGDVAFVDYSRFLTGKNKLIDESINQSMFRVICKNGSLSSTPGLIVDNDCLLGIGIRGEILSRAVRTGVKERDLSELFLNMNNWFGYFHHSRDGVMKMFGRFQGVRDLLFRDGTVSLIMKSDPNYEFANSFRDFIKDVNDEQTPSASSILMPSLCLVFGAWLLTKYQL